MDGASSDSKQNPNAARAATAGCSGGNTPGEAWNADWDQDQLSPGADPC